MVMDGDSTWGREHTAQYMMMCYRIVHLKPI